MALSTGGSQTILPVPLTCTLKSLSRHSPSHRNVGGKFCAGGFFPVALLQDFYMKQKKNPKNKAYLKVFGVLFHILFMLCFCFADTRSPFSWGEDKEGIPPNIIKTGPTLVSVILSCSQSFSDPQETADEMDLHHTKEPGTA